ncbi:nuclear transport factor 2 family protein [Pelomonas sp. KK5]|uniref:nuclear transport factor 2 family protein n=1 Tax=Pelomonas sp. KK5 TaxID=1855730 RepID=UPI001E3A8555|nr:nuclear transport factor 2 family protein [Pelomonas sp. KK5]
MAQLEARLRRFEDAEAIRACVHRYMALCDRLDASTPLAELLDCFTADALWTGNGARYAASFGGYQGRDEIGAMFRRYMSEPAHFAMNAHFLCNEQIDVQGDAATASWLMLQPSTFATGASHLNAARLTLEMARCAEDGPWRIARFETENVFSRPVSHWHSEAALPVPNPPTELTTQ